MPGDMILSQLLGKFRCSVSSALAGHLASHSARVPATRAGRALADGQLEARRKESRLYCKSPRAQRGPAPTASRQRQLRRLNLAKDGSRLREECRRVTGLVWQEHQCAGLLPHLRVHIHVLTRQFQACCLRAARLRQRVGGDLDGLRVRARLLGPEFLNACPYTVLSDDDIANVESTLSAGPSTIVQYNNTLPVGKQISAFVEVIRN